MLDIRSRSTSEGVELSQLPIAGHLQWVEFTFLALTMLLVLMRLGFDYV
jgi:hydroxylamine reductase (hybrid-cluster protein)